MTLEMFWDFKNILHINKSQNNVYSNLLEKHSVNSKPFPGLESSFSNFRIFSGISWPWEPCFYLLNCPAPAPAPAPQTALVRHWHMTHLTQESLISFQQGEINWMCITTFTEIRNRGNFWGNSTPSICWCSLDSGGGGVEPEIAEIHP